MAASRWQDTHPRYLQGHYWYNRRLNRTYWDPPNTNSPEEIAMFLGIRLESAEEAEARQKEEHQGEKGEKGEDEAPGAEAAADGVKAADEVAPQGGSNDGPADSESGAQQQLSGDEESGGGSERKEEEEGEDEGEEGEGEEAGYRIMADGSKVTAKQVEAARKAMEAEEQEEREEEMREAAEAKMVKEVLGVDLTSFMEFCDQWQLGRVNAKSRGAANVPSAEELLLMERDRTSGGRGGGGSKRDATRQSGKRGKRKGGDAK